MYVASAISFVMGATRLLIINGFQVLRYGTRRPLFTSIWHGLFPQLNHHILHWLNHSAACQAQAGDRQGAVRRFPLSRQPLRAACRRSGRSIAEAVCWPYYDRVVAPAGLVLAAAAAAQAPAPAAPAFPFRYFPRCLSWFSKFKVQAGLRRLLLSKS